MIYFMLLRLSPLFGTSLAEDPQKESSAFSKKHPRRFSYTPRAFSIPYLSGTSFLQRHPTSPSRSVLWPLLHSALVQVLTIAQGHKKPRRLKWHIGTIDCVSGTRCVLFRRCLGSSMWPLPRIATVAAC